jgi:hypothetical protein
MDRWQSLVTKVMDLRVTGRVVNVSTICATTSQLNTLPCTIKIFLFVAKCPVNSRPHKSWASGRPTD